MRFLFSFKSRLDSNENLSNLEFLIEKEIDGVAKIAEEHLMLKSYYRESSNKPCSIDYNLILNLLNRILKNGNHGNTINV